MRTTEIREKIDSKMGKDKRVERVKTLMQDMTNKGERANERKALQQLWREISRESLGKKVITGFWMTDHTNKQGRKRGYVLSKKEIISFSLEGYGGKIPVELTPVVVPLEKFKTLSEGDDDRVFEFYELDGDIADSKELNSNHITDFTQSITDIVDGLYCIPCAVKFVNDVQFKDGERLEAPMPVFNDDGSMNLRTVLCDPHDRNIEMTMKIPNPSVLIDIYGVDCENPDELIDWLRQNNHMAVMNELKSIMGKEIVVFGSASKYAPSSTDTVGVDKEELKRPYITVSYMGWVKDIETVMTSFPEKTKQTTITQQPPNPPKKVEPKPQPKAEPKPEAKDEAIDDLFGDDDGGKTEEKTEPKTLDQELMSLIENGKGTKDNIMALKSKYNVKDIANKMGEWQKNGTINKTKGDDGKEKFVKA